MEQKRVLWIVAAVGLFLLVVIGTALWISSPINKTQPTLSTVQVAGNSWNRTPQSQVSNVDLYGMNTSTSGDSIKSIDLANDTTMQTQSPINLNNLDSSSSAADSSTANDSRTSNAGLAQTAVTLNVNITPTTGSTAGYNEVAQQTAPSAAGQTTQPAQTVQPATTGASSNQQVSSAKTSASSAQTTAAAPKTTAASDTNKTTTSASSASASKTATSASASSSSGVKTVPTNQPDQFWVQVASFTGKKNAEDARSALAEQKITGEVFTYQDAKGTIYYRLRVGPYKTKSEAEYWHKIIKEIEQFKGTDSYVVNSTVR